MKDKYCKFCGTKLEKTLISLDNYDEDTGERKYKLHYKCPNKGGWLRSYHSDYDYRTHVGDLAVFDNKGVLMKYE